MSIDLKLLNSILNKPFDYQPDLQQLELLNAVRNATTLDQQELSSIFSNVFRIVNVRIVNVDAEIQKLCIENKFKEAMGLTEKEMKAGYLPNVETAGRLITLCGANNQLAKAHEIFMIVRKHTNHCPPPIIYQSLIEAHLVNGKFNAIDVLTGQMQKEGLELDYALKTKIAVYKNLKQIPPNNNQPVIPASEGSGYKR